jgi:hypothetical protein
MALSRLHQQVTAIALRAAAGHGFALGGGNALIAHGMIIRPTQDVDLFTDQDQGVATAAGPVEAALRQGGFQAERQDLAGGLTEIFDGIADELAEWVLTAPGGEQTVLQLAYFERTARPVTMDFGPVLDLQDVVGGKVCALASRAEPRDYIDVAAALSRYTVTEVISFARRLDPGLENRDFADAGTRLDQWGDHVFAAFALTPADITQLRRQFIHWPRN